jgi:hypothetical protein
MFPPSNFPPRPTPGSSSLSIIRPLPSLSPHSRRSERPWRYWDGGISNYGYIGITEALQVTTQHGTISNSFSSHAAGLRPNCADGVVSPEGRIRQPKQPDSRHHHIPSIPITEINHSSLVNIFIHLPLKHKHNAFKNRLQAPLHTNAEKEKRRQDSVCRDDKKNGLCYEQQKMRKKETPNQKRRNRI